MNINILSSVFVIIRVITVSGLAKGVILTTNVYAETELSVIVKLSAEHEAPAFAKVLLAAGDLNLIVR
jgi:hypothetical protein